MEIIEDNDLLLFDDVPDKSRIAAQYFALDTVPGRMRAANLARSLTGGHYRLDFALASGLCMDAVLPRFRDLPFRRDIQLLRNLLPEVPLTLDL